MSSPPTEDLNVDYPRPWSKFKKNVAPPRCSPCLDKSLAPLPSIRTFANGSFAKIFLITFSDNTEAIVRAPFPHRDYSEQRMRSEVATILFAQEHLGMPIPRLFAWAVTPQNVAGAPYLLMERLPGVKISGQMWFTNLSQADNLRILEHITVLHARLAQPLPFEEVGNLYLLAQQVCPREEPKVPMERFYVGPFVQSQRYTNEREDVPSPTTNFQSILDYWKMLADLEIHAGYARWARQPDTYIVPEEDAGAVLNYRPQTTADFADTFRNLGVILGAYSVPPEFSSLCICHNDFSLHNFLVDPATLEITGILDWEDVSIEVPVVLASRCPEELEHTNNSFNGWFTYPR